MEIPVFDIGDFMPEYEIIVTEEHIFTDTPTYGPKIIQCAITMFPELQSAINEFPVEFSVNTQYPDISASLTEKPSLINLLTEKPILLSVTRW